MSYDNIYMPKLNLKLLVIVINSSCPHYRARTVDSLDFHSILILVLYTSYYFFYFLCLSVLIAALALL